MNLLEGLNKVLLSEHSDAEYIRESLAKLYNILPDDKESLFSTLLLNIKKYAEYIGNVGETFNWDFHLLNPTLLEEYYDLAYEKFDVLFKMIAEQHGYNEKDFQTELYWVPTTEHLNDITGIEIIKEWHSEVTYKGIRLFWFALTPLYEGDIVAFISEDVEEMFDCELFGYEPTPHIEFYNRIKLTQFLHTFFDHADIKRFLTKEMSSKKVHYFQMWIGSVTEEGQKFADEVVKPKLKAARIKSFIDSSGETIFLVNAITSKKAIDIANECKMINPDVSWIISDS